MQAAVVSILLMVGACGQSVATDDLQPTAVVRVVAPACDCGPNVAQRPEIVLPGEICQRVDLVFFKVYTPVLLMHGNAEFYPGNYARPYDYREKFDYPWYGPRPCRSMTPIASPEVAAQALPGRSTPPTTADAAPSPRPILIR